MTVPGVDALVAAPSWLDGRVHGPGLVGKGPHCRLSSFSEVLVWR